ncbi:PREDICTED: uncharacterized protein LOC105150806 [Acromyrmex echinatior]|uniref:uncharacterized protein LOC105150806 n=1 Tax=Acromyrmex echinatior TaxID=103372 RepID=UPI000581076C|nr:PREDICTED: uncharacterized protein LOC105150806 [Acromyrmex echinatior]
MALKKNMSILEGEQLYMLEILIGRLNLCPEQTVSNEGCNLMIRIGFVDLKPVDIIAKESIKVNDERTRSKENGFSNEYINYEGKTCLLVRTPSNLIQSIKSTPLSIEVYKISLEEDHNLRDNARFVLFCAATAFLPRNFCDHITAAKNKIDGLSKSYVSTKIYTLTDEYGNPCGSISMCMRLSCFGSSIINHLVFREKSFILRGFPFGWELSCTKLSNESENNERYMKKCDNDTSSLHKILDSTYSKLYNHDDRTETEPVLTRPESPPRISMNEPGFEELTSAKKLNDHEYRGLICEIYHDEPTYSCLPTDQSTHPTMCRSGCVLSCCMSLRNPDSLKKSSSLATLASDNFYLKSDMQQNVTCHDSARLKDGEDAEDNYLNNKASWDEGYTWHENDINLKNRMVGGSDYGASARALAEATTVIYEKDKRTGANLALGSRTADEIKRTNCVCPGNVSSPWKTNASRCSKKPCVGAECMIRAFKEVQEFVDSLGKVPGMQGLGLMDPSESPYFGRDIQCDYTVQKIPSERKRGYPISALPGPTVQCPAPCNTQIGKPLASTLSAPYVASTSVTVPGRSGVVREAIPSLPETASFLTAVKPSKKKEDKKEEKLEKQKELDVTTSAPLDVVDVGPCGEPKCKSRRKKKNSRTMSHDNEDSETKPIQTLPPTTLSIATTKAVGKLIEKGHPKSRPGPSGDRGRNSIKVSRRVMRYIYSIGDVYPGTNYGHKNCIDPRFRVPANMGWLWNTRASADKFKPRIGWKPGAIGRYLNILLKEAKGATMEDYRAKSTPSRTLRRDKMYKTISYVSQVKKETEENAEPPPTLHIHRKDGTYYVTMYPIRQETNVSQVDEPMKPLQFKIVRNKDDASVASSSTASDMEIEFSPPAAVNRYRKKPDVIHVDTQVKQQEILDAFKLTVERRVDTTPKAKEKSAKKERKGKK